MKRPKNGQIQLKKPKNSIVENLKFFDLIFWWDFPFSMVILWLQKIVLYVNNQIQLRKCKFSGTLPLRFCRKGGTPKTTKNCPKVPKMPFLPFWWPDIIKIVANYVWNKFRDISGQKVLIKKKFPFLHRKTMIFQKKFWKRSKSTFLSPETWLDVFSIKF